MYAVIPAAGTGSRLVQRSVSCSKVLLPLFDGITTLEVTLRSVVEADVCRGIVVVARAEEQEYISEILSSVAPGLEQHVVVGGETRQDSVYSGLQVLEGKAEFVLVHDAARPLCSAENIAAVAHAGLKNGAAILAVPHTSTVKEVIDGHTVANTVPRRNLWIAQTPQVFKFELLLEAHRAALRDNYIGTDESELVERLGKSIHIVRGRETNLKITTPSDLELALALMAVRSRTQRESERSGELAPRVRGAESDRPAAA